jgi:cephalosporin-C deacetylase-like acetyl esterase
MKIAFIVTICALWSSGFLARWEIGDSIRALDYRLPRPDVYPERINITGTLGGGTQASYIAALDPGIHCVKF